MVFSVNFIYLLIFSHVLLLFYLHVRLLLFEICLQSKIS
jgi:hypothetical protein